MQHYINPGRAYRFSSNPCLLQAGIKQHLKIQSFWGFSENTVKTQIWIAIGSYLIVAIAKKQLNLKYSMYEMLQLISHSTFQRTPIKKLIEQAKYQEFKEQNHNQLKMF